MSVKLFILFLTCDVCILEMSLVTVFHVPSVSWIYRGPELVHQFLFLFMNWVLFFGCEMHLFLLQGTYWIRDMFGVVDHGLLCSQRSKWNRRDKSKQNGHISPTQSAIWTNVLVV